MSTQGLFLYIFGPFSMDPRERLLLRNGKPIPIPPKAFDTLLLLVESNGRLVEKQELIRKIWPDSFVEEANLSLNISLARKALGDNTSRPKYIKTVHKSGYRFVAAVEVRELEGKAIDREGTEQNRDIPVSTEPNKLPDRSSDKFKRYIAKHRLLLIILFIGGVGFAGLAIKLSRSFSKAPYITGLTILTDPVPNKQFTVQIQAEGISTELVELVVVGPGCPRVGNCTVPNNVMEGVSKTQIASAPLTLSAGVFQLYIRNGPQGRLSNAWQLNIIETLTPDISADGDPANWEGIKPTIVDPLRDGPFDSTRKYAPGNDFISISIKHDNNNVYFLLEFAETYAGSSALFLDTDLDRKTGCSSNRHWEGTEFIIFTSESSLLALGDWRQCTYRDDFPNTIRAATRGKFVEAYFPLSVLRQFSQNMKGFRISAIGNLPGRSITPDYVEPTLYLLNPSMESKMAGLISPGLLNPTRLHSPNQSKSVFDLQKQMNSRPGRGLSILARGHHETSQLLQIQ